MPVTKSETTKPTAPKKNGGRKPSAYNAYMKVQLAKLKDKDPEQSHKDRFKMVAKMWATAPENPRAGENKAKA